jgi:hypothetical protein
MKQALLFLVCVFMPLSLQAETTTYKYNFSKNDHFQVSFADYPQGEELFYELAFKNNTLLPPEIHTQQHSLKISGNNHSDDLFMYAYKKVTGLKPNTTYHVNFSLEFASNAPTGSIGTGGASGDSVYVKIGAVSTRPKRRLDDSGYYRMALDKGNQERDGKDMILIGTIGVESQNESYRLKTLPYQTTKKMRHKLSNYTVTSNNMGEVWVVFGTDSGFESTSTLFYTNLTVAFTEMP